MRRARLSARHLIPVLLLLAAILGATWWLTDNRREASRSSSLLLGQEEGSTGLPEPAAAPHLETSSMPGAGAGSATQGDGSTGPAQAVPRSAARPPLRSAEPTPSPHWLERVQRSIATHEYWASVNPQGLQAPNRAHGFRTYFTPDGIRLVDRTSPGGRDLAHLSAYGLGTNRGVARLPAAQVDHRENRVELSRGSVTEWYLNGEKGLEQGFTVASPPGSDGQLVLELSVASADAVRDGDAIWLRTEAGRDLRYEKLRVEDARGTVLASHMEVPAPDRIQLWVDDSNAAYPIVIDPLITAAADDLIDGEGTSHLGSSIAGAGDVNGDGYDDVIVGSGDFDGGEVLEGAAFLFLGGGTGIMTGDISRADARFESNMEAARLGWSVASAGDVNGDGFDDVILGAPGYSSGDMLEGGAFIFHGSIAGIADGTPLTADTQLESDQGDAQLGAVASAGDVNGDGFDDVIVGAGFYDSGENDEGAAFVFLGRAAGIPDSTPMNAHAQLESDNADAHFGLNAVAGAGDVNGDGYDDILVGAPDYDGGEVDEGAAFLFLAQSDGSGIADAGASAASASFQADAAGAYLGTSVAGAGDVNGDGFDDILIGGTHYNSTGAAWLYLGSASGIASGTPATASAQLEADQSWARFGASVASAGDVNADGFADIVIGSDFYDNPDNEGAAFVYLGSSSGIASGDSTTAAVQLYGEQPLSQFSFQVANLGDVNGDGASDLGLGVVNFDGAAVDAGRAFVYHGWTPASGAADWLAANQNLDGSWGRTPYQEQQVTGGGDLRPVHTSEAVLALRAFGRAGTAYHGGITWLENQEMQNVDYQARRILALYPHGDDVSAAVGKIESAIYATPYATTFSHGWGASRAYVPSPVDSALAVHALSVVDPAHPLLAETLLGVNQQESGGWTPVRQGDTPTLNATAAVLRAFAANQANFPTETSAGAAAFAVLSTADYSSESDLVRAHAALAMLRWSPGTTAADPLLGVGAYAGQGLAATRSDDGSWGQDPYTTALALHAYAARYGIDEANLLEPIVIADSELRAAIHRAVGNRRDGDVVTRGDLLKLTSLDLRPYRVTDLHGLGEAANLRTLHLSYNTSPDLTPISGLLGNVTPEHHTQSHSPPTGVDASDGVSAQWVDVTWDGVEGASYSVYRCTGSDLADCGQALESGLATSSYRDESAVAGELYVYRVTADAAGDPGTQSTLSTGDGGFRALRGPTSKIVEIASDAIPAFSGPSGVTSDASGRVYVSSLVQSTVWEITPPTAASPSIQVTPLVDSTGDGTNSLIQAGAVVASRDGSLFVVGELSNNVFEVDTLGTITQVVSSSDGLTYPSDLALDRAGNLYVAGRISNNVLKRTPDGTVTVILDSTGDGTNALDTPSAVAATPYGQVFVAGEASDNVFSISTSGSVTQVLDAAGDGTVALDAPAALATNATGRVFVAATDSDNVFEVTPAGEKRLVLDGSGAGGVLLMDPNSLAIDELGTLFISSWGSDAVFRRSYGGAVDLLLDAGGDGSASLSLPAGLDVDRAGNVYVAGAGSNNVFRLSTRVHEVATAESLGSAALQEPMGVAADLSGRGYATGFLSDNLVEIATDGSAIERMDLNGDGQTDFNAPGPVAVDDEGYIYASTIGSDNVFKVSPWGEVTKILDATGDGTGPLDRPIAIAVDRWRNVFVAGQLSNNVFHISPDGSITKVLDSTNFGLAAPSAVAVVEDRLYVAGSASNNVIEMSKTAGPNPVWGAPEEILPAGAGVSFPIALAVDSERTVYVAGHWSDNVLSISRYGDVAEVLSAAGDGVNALAEPIALAVDDADALYVAGASSNNLFKRSRTGDVVKLADFSGDGVARLDHVVSAAVGSMREAYVAADQSDAVLRVDAIPVPEPRAVVQLLVLGAGLFAIHRSHRRSTHRSTINQHRSTKSS